MVLAVKPPKSDSTMLDQITPVILTYNEARNIGRTLERLRWARDIVLVDSFSNDGTVEIISRFPNTRLFQHRFEDFAAQWRFGINETSICSDWVLALDADFMITNSLVEELRSLRPPAKTLGYKIPIAYCVYGKRLRSSLLPPLTILYRRAACRFSADGHTYRVALDGEVGILRTPILHDDRKPLSSWCRAQHRYSIAEGNKLLDTDSQSLNLPDRIRRMRVISPLAVLVYCLIYKGGLLDGRAGLYYAFQRLFAEILLSLYLLEHDLRLSGKCSDGESGLESTERIDKSACAVDKHTDAVA